MLGSAEVVTFIATLDPEKAREFYEETLGLHFVKDDSFAMVFEMGKEPGVEGGGVPLRVVKVGTLLPHPFTVLGWNVADIMKTVTALAERGISFERYAWMKQDGMGVWTAPDGTRVAWFKDPDGNLLSVSQFA
ncbi:MAG: VOC family protein [Acidobacteriia bacterium]|nr:VOC family protein [Terriglobia bacterium]